MRSQSGRLPYGASFKPEQPTVNIVPFIVALVVIVAGLAVTMQGTWVGQLLRGENKRQVDPLANLTYLQARDAIESRINQGLTSVGAKAGKITWKSVAGGSGKPDERSIDAPVELKIDTSLPNPATSKQVIEPVKPYLDKAKVQTLTMTDSKSHATWTYNVTFSAPADADSQ